MLYFLSAGASECIIDLAFIIDASASVRDDWSIQLNFVVDVAKRINIGPQGSHIGLVQFGDDSRKEFDFREFDKTPYNQRNILQKITSLPRPRQGARTFINRGLRRANREIFRTEFGMRPNVKKVCFGTQDPFMSNAGTIIITSSMFKRLSHVTCMLLALGSVTLQSKLLTPDHRPTT